MKSVSIIAAAVATIAAIAIGVYMIDVEQTEQASLPDVDVSVEGGNMPEFDAEVGSIEMTEETVDVTVPNVDVTMEEEQIAVPGIEIVTPEEEAAGEDVADNN